MDEIQYGKKKKHIPQSDGSTRIEHESYVAGVAKVNKIEFEKSVAIKDKVQALTQAMNAIELIHQKKTHTVFIEIYADKNDYDFFRFVVKWPEDMR